jgi:NADH:ubiquinone oxidoreductase subunit K
MLDSPVTIGFVGVLGLFGVGLYGLLITRNLIKVVVALQILVKAALLALVAAGNASGQTTLAQSLAVTVIVADTIVAVIALALAVQVRRRFGTLDVRTLSDLRG